uniref:Homeobox domain-containing protein n=1 Tax=Globodera pallida TaxID=36090 RepID=A0A183C5F7_GLOPA
MYSNFDQLFAHLRGLCSNDNSAFGIDLMPAITENCYFGALRSVLETEKQKTRPMTAEISHSATALAFSLDSSTTEKGVNGKNCALEKTLTECKEFCRGGSEVDSEMTNKMQQTLEEYEHIGQLIDQNTIVCLQNCHRLFAVHAQLRPIVPADVQQFGTVLQLFTRKWKGELKDAVCSQLLLIKARGGQKKKRQNFSRETIRILNDYFVEHIDLPYPDDSIKMALAEKCGITLAQVSNWFGNKRIRFRKSQMKAIERGTKCVPMNSGIGKKEF